MLIQLFKKDYMFPAADDWQTLALQVSILGSVPLERLLNRLDIQLPPEVVKTIPR